MSFNNVYVRTLAASELLDHGKSAVTWDTIDLTREAKSARKGEARWTIAKPQTIYGFAYWWVAELGAGQLLSTGPGAARTHWEQLYFPLLEPIAVEVRRDDCPSRSKSRSSEASGTHLAWTATHRCARQAAYAPSH